MTTFADPNVVVRLLKDELDSWRPFLDALREDDREVGRKLLARCWKYTEAIESSKKPYLVEPFFLSVLLVQEERITALETELKHLGAEVENRKSKVGF
ncbi:MAG: hypothetical protein OK422_03075 [Thaumarchaeota archaeon]|nr:hypothetical protein [Nitrososphaerota archaeon]